MLLPADAAVDLRSLRERRFEAQAQALAQCGREVVALVVGVAITRLFGYALWIQLPIPYEDVEPFNLLDEHEDRSAGRADLGPLVTLEAGGPLL